MKNKFYALRQNLEETGGIGSASLLIYEGSTIASPLYFTTNPSKIEIHNGLGRRAKLTDFIFPIRLLKIYTLLFSSKVKTLLSKFNLPQHYTTSLDVKKGAHQKEYCFFLFKESVYDYIRLDTIEIKRYNTKTRDWRNITNCGRYVQNVLVRGVFGYDDNIPGDIYSRITKLELKEGFDLDLFSVGNLLNTCIVSQRLKEAIEKNGVTGITFEKLEYISVAQK